MALSALAVLLLTMASTSENAHVLIILQRLARLIEQPGRIRAGIFRLLENDRKHEAGGGGADGAAQQLLREMDQRHIRRLVVIEFPARRFLIGRKRAQHALFAKITGNRAFEVADADTGFPAARGELRFRMALDEDTGLDALHRPRIARERTQHECEAVDEQAEDDRIHERIGFGTVKHRAAGKQEAENIGRDFGIVRPAEARQEQQIGPDEEARTETRDCATGIGATPEQPAEEGRGHLGDGGESQKADGGKARGAVGGAVITVTQKHHRKDRRPADVEQRLGEVVPVRRAVE